MSLIDVKGYQNLVTKADDIKSNKLFVYFTGSKVNGISWCPDCVNGECMSFFIAYFFEIFKIALLYEQYIF